MCIRDTINAGFIGDKLPQEKPRPDPNELKFLGWYTEPSGGNEIKETTQFTESKTVYAHWAEDGWFIDSRTNTLVAAGSAAVGPYELFWFLDINPSPMIYHSSAPWGYAMLSGKVETIQIKGGVTEIGAYAFFGGDASLSLGNPPYPSTLTSVSIPDSVKSIGEHAFGYNTALTDISLPSGLTSLGDLAFRYCSSLTKITIPEGVTSIGESTFYQCTSLRNVTISDNVTSIGDFAFEHCSSLTSVSLPSKLKIIGKYAFAFSGLTSVTIPEGVTSIGDSAFANCDSLTTINFDGTQAQWNAMYRGSDSIPANVTVKCTDGDLTPP